MGFKGLYLNERTIKPFNSLQQVCRQRGYSYLLKAPNILVSIKPEILYIEIAGFTNCYRFELMDEN
jgi:hypothetical protein